jgi:hypothetical protein
MKDRRNRFGVAILNLVVMLTMFMPEEISASSTQLAIQETNSTQDTSPTQVDNATDMRINEVMFYPELGGYEWVELKNAGLSPMNIAGWGLTDEDGNWYKFPQALPDVPADDFVVIIFVPIVLIYQGWS